MKKVVVLTGAGISAESGLKTFRDENGLWNNYRFEEVASIDAWNRNPELVLGFYNQRRKQLFEVEPNTAHLALVQLEQHFDVQIITQNVDDLHERAGSSKILHLHGELKKARSTSHPDIVVELDHWELKKGDKCEKGSQLRPHIVWFGEPVPMMMDATALTAGAEIFIIIGTSMLVYPAAGLVNYVPYTSIKYYIDPKAEKIPGVNNLKCIQKKATEGVPEVVEELIGGGW